MSLELTVPKLACSSCVDTITKAIHTIDSQADIQANTKTKIVSVETQAPATAIKQALANVGYPSI
ncbi:MAG TPA: heavy-metal-associated domain-containing protein [Nostocaceae cyanobacterium]|nr:heavy-metal-associated domain-containing protein [Nostocaceae cyanobacterium]